ncbi:unnamed protein product [Rotaria sp. Silwood1]|nr:unnamed protein product [Rotaria sp. Silwood1]CAF3365719.1 unnamed protein product [Rotaria sp. Silwood1]CAF5064462.1 unnamed protein product [Rotaria sp. Silwood1]
MYTKDIYLTDIYCNFDINKKNVQIFDQLNKDDSRHLVLNQYIHKKQFSYETFNRVEQANKRWKYFFNWNLSTLDLVAKYFDQLNLCQQCINHFITQPIDEQQISIDSDEDENDE